MKTKDLVNLQAEIYSQLHPTPKRLLNNLRLIPRYLHWRVNQNGYRHTVNILNPLKDKFSGCRCIVIGNGPSLRQMNLSCLENEFTFGLNRIYLLFEELGFETSFFVSINKFVLHQFNEEINKIRTLKILNWAEHENFQADEKTAFLAAKPGDKLDGNIINGYYAESFTVTNVALELAFFFGFSEVLLIGVDHSFTDKGTANRAVVSKSEDQNHFSSNYFGPGVIWQLPDLSAMEAGYQKTKKLFDMNGRKIIDATRGGKLQVFEKAILEDCLRENNYHNKLSYKG